MKFCPKNRKAVFRAFSHSMIIRSKFMDCALQVTLCITSFSVHMHIGVPKQV